jgi:DNA-binding NtrC family response regulator
MRRVLEAAAQAASSMPPVLITGEPGTGRGLVAMSVHFAGPRALAPFVSIDCGAIPEQHLHRQLFGAVAGIADGAAVPPAGFVHLAKGGTLFLRNISRLPPHSQAELLHALGTTGSRIAGSTREPAGAVRPIAASDGSLPERVARGGFRQDLLDRLGEITILVPPLRERREDIPVLARRFLTCFATDRGRPVPGFSDEALGAVTGYAWPGNVAELQNCMRQLARAAAGDTIEIQDLPEPVRCRGHGPADTTLSLVELEASHIRSVLAAAKGNKTRAAGILGINRKTLRAKLRHLGQTPGRA